MTALAYRDGVLAADRQVTLAGMVEVTEKLYVINTAKYGKAMVALSGPLKSTQQIVEWLQVSKEERNTPFDGMTAEARYGILVTEQKTVHPIYGTGYVGFAEADMPFIADGSAYHFLMGAMATGAGAIEAVELACIYCEGVGRGVSHLNWSDIFDSDNGELPF